jgi:hypothetical protein
MITFISIKTLHMITDINLRKLRNAEFVQFMTDAQTILHAFPPDALESGTQIGTFSILVAELQILFHSEQVSPQAHDIHGLDAARDRLMSGLVKLCDAYTYGPNPDKRAAADLLSSSLDKYGTGIANQNYQAESATITNILADWSTHPPFTAAAALIGAEEWIAALQAANEEFKAAYLKRTTAMASATPTDAFRDKRMETADAWKRVCSRLDSFFTIHEGAAPWSTAIAQLNALIDQYNAMLSARRADSSR